LLELGDYHRAILWQSASLDAPGVHLRHHCPASLTGILYTNLFNQGM
jgi:hypothetical protein